MHRLVLGLAACLLATTANGIDFSSFTPVPAEAVAQLPKVPLTVIDAEGCILATFTLHCVSLSSAGSSWNPVELQKSRQPQLANLTLSTQISKERLIHAKLSKILMAECR
jgi:hypothetical protein